MGKLIVIHGADFKENNIGKVEIPTCKHIYSNACDTTCNLCGHVRTAEHSFDAGVVTKAVTCTEAGEMLYTCTICGAVKTETITAAGHNFVDGVCTVCGVKDPAYVTINDYPVTDTLLGLYDLGYNDANTSLINHSPLIGGIDGTDHSKTPALQGAYQLNDKYVTFTGAGGTAGSRMLTYVPTSLTDETITLIALFSVPDGQNPNNRVIMGNRASGTAAQIGVNMLNDRAVFSKNGDSVVDEEMYSYSINSNNFAILALRVRTGSLRVDRYTNGGLDAMMDEYEGNIDAWTNRSIIIGGDSTGNMFGNAHISLAAIHKGDMKDEQLESICDFVKRYGERKGLTIE